MSDLALLHAAIAAVCPIDGVNSDGRIDFKPQATTQQRSDAAAVLAGWDSSPSAQAAREKLATALETKSAIGNPANKNNLSTLAVLSLILDQLNIIRSKLSPPLSALTLNQVKQAYKDKIDSLIS